VFLDLIVDGVGRVSKTGELKLGVKDSILMDTEKRL
jgi:hypothetical protein